jgi:hypothetical protein
MKMLMEPWLTIPKFAAPVQSTDMNTVPPEVTADEHTRIVRGGLLGVTLPPALVMKLALPAEFIT